MAFQFKLPVLADPLKRNRYEVTNPETFVHEKYELLVLDEGAITTPGKPINIENMNAFSQYVEDGLDTKEPKFAKNTAFNKNFGNQTETVCQGNDGRLSDSRKCNNMFDDATTSKTNLGLHKVASSGNYNDLTNKPYIPNEYDFFPGIFMAAVAGFSNLSRLTTSDSVMTKSLNYKKKYCFLGYGGYTAGLISSVSGGYWAGRALDFESNIVVVPTYTGSMAGYQKCFEFITNGGIYRYVANSGVNDITIRISRPDCYAYSEVAMYNYY